MLEAIDRLRTTIQSIYLGPTDAVDLLLRCLLARGHALIEDVPGVGKTVLATTIAKSIDCSFSRIQLTPDMLPGDVLGVTVFDRTENRFEFKPGPIFANLVLADEINRTTPRTQTALLEAMNEGSVSIDGVVHRLEQPFMVLATQNPYEFEGTYLLPENQLDRFLFKLRLGYPSAEAESRLLELRPSLRAMQELKPVAHAQDIVALQEKVDAVKIAEELRRYIIELATRTRDHDELQVGISPRGALSLAQAARATAMMDGREYVIPEDILTNVVPVCGHRIITRAYGTGGNDRVTAEILETVLQSVPSPA